MKIIDRYLLKNFLPPLFYCLIIFLFLYIIIDLFGHLDDILKNKVDMITLLYYYSLFIPLIFVQTSPLAILISTIYSLNNLNRHNEIVALRCGGISILRILLPLLTIGFILSSAAFIVNDKFVPESLQVAMGIKEQQIEKNIKRQKQRLIQDVAFYAKENRIIYARLYEIDKKKLSDVIIHQQDQDQNLKMRISAEAATWDNERWVFQNCLIQNLNGTGKTTGEPEFHEEMIIDLDQKPQDLLHREWRMEYMNYKELKENIVRFRGISLQAINRLRVELAYRFSFALINFIIILVGAPFAFISRRGGALFGLGMAIFVGFAFYGVMAISTALGKAGILHPILAAWLSDILFLGLGIYLLKRSR